MQVDIAALLKQHVPQAAPSQIAAIVAAVAAGEPQVKPPAPGNDAPKNDGEDMQLTEKQRQLLADAEAADKKAQERESKFQEILAKPTHELSAEDKSFLAAYARDGWEELQQP
jgi:hypothetical protein